MKVAHTIVAVLADPAECEVNLVFAGLRVTLAADEAALLADMLRNGFELLLSPQLGAAATMETSNASDLAAMSGDEQPSPICWDVAARPGAATAAGSEEAQAKTRKLIWGRMKDKGLSLPEKHRT
jgi:hypothetical protein